MKSRQLAAIGLGCMRLSTSADRDFDGAVSVIHAALDAGATLLDTADVYCRDEHDIGHNERLVAHAPRELVGPCIGGHGRDEGGV